MALPYDCYIRFLITKGIDDLGEINRELAVLDLPEATSFDVKKQSQLIDKYLPQDARTAIDAKHYTPQFLEWMAMIDLAKLWEYEGSYRTQDSVRLMRAVYDIHYDPRLRVAINALLIKGTSRAVMARKLSAKHSADLSEEIINVYAETFFDCSKMRRADWRKYISRVENQDEVRLYFAALTEDAYLIETELGLDAQAPVGNMLQFMLVKSFQKVKDLCDVGTPDTDKESRNWMKHCLTVIEKYDKYKSSDMDDFKSNLQLEFRYDEGYEIPAAQDSAEFRQAMADAATNEKKT